MNFPVLKEVLPAVLPYFLPLAALGVSSGVSFREMRDALRDRASLARICTICLIGAPLVAILACKVFRQEGLALAVILLTSIAPGDPLAVLESEERHGDVRLALALTIVLTVLMPLSLLAWTPILDLVFSGNMHESAAGAFVKVVSLVDAVLAGR